MQHRAGLEQRAMLARQVSALHAQNQTLRYQIHLRDNRIANQRQVYRRAAALLEAARAAVLQRARIPAAAMECEDEYCVPT